MPPRGDKDHYGTKEAFLQRIGPRLRLSQTVTEFHANDPTKNLMHGHIKDFTYKKILEAFELELKVEDVAIFKDAVFSDVTNVAYALKGWHFIFYRATLFT